MAMESMAGGAMKIVLGKLGTLLGKEYKLLKGLKREAESLQAELNNMHAYLQELPVLDEDLSPQLRLWRNEVRELSYNVEDSLDKYMLRAEQERRMGFIDRSLSLYSSTKAHHQIAKEIQRLKVHAMEAGARRTSYRFGELTTVTSMVTIDRRLPGFGQPNFLVGIEEKREKIKKWLVDNDEDLKVISIVGSGGLGKTTLAIEVCRTVKEKFECCALVSVTQNLDIKRLLSDVLSQVDPDYFNSDAHEEQLARRLARLLGRKRYLIIIDDIWNVEAWEQVKGVFPINRQCSRIVTTTRNRNVAKACQFSFRGFVYEIKHLSDDDSRKLFFNRIFGSEQNCPEELRQVSIEVLKRCDGLPLAITTMSSLLASKSATKEMMDTIRKTLFSGAELNYHVQKMRRILLLSYSDLPSHLKICFLYLSVFPEDCKINKRYLVWRWIAEGFISTKTEESLQDIGESYFNELINRSLIMPLDIQCDGTVEACRVHDMVLELITSLSAEEKFVCVSNGNNFIGSSKNSTRWLSIQAKSAHVKKSDVFKCSSHLRSFSIFGSVKEMPQLKDLHLLRVLDIEYGECLGSHHIEHIGSCVQMKYLRIQNTNINMLPNQIGDLQYLEILDLKHNKIRSLPASVVRLEKLVCLLVDTTVALPDGIGNMKSLEVLADLNVCQNSVIFVEELGNLAKLRELQIYWNPYDINGKVQEFKNIFIRSLQKLGKQNLKSLSISGDDSRHELMEACCSLPQLEKLAADEDHICRVPSQINILVHLTWLTVYVCEITKEDIKMLGNMSSLVFLKIHLQNTTGVRLGIGRHEGQFQSLKEFFFRSRGIGVVFFPGAMPMLQRLHLQIGEWEETDMNSNFNLGVEHLPQVQHIHVVINCLGADGDDVGSFEDAIRDATALAPLSPMLQITRWKEHDMATGSIVLMPEAPRVVVDSLYMFKKCQYRYRGSKRAPQKAILTVKMDTTAQVLEAGVEAESKSVLKEDASSFEEMLEVCAEVVDVGRGERTYKLELENGFVLAVRTLNHCSDRGAEERCTGIRAIGHEHIAPLLGYKFDRNCHLLFLLYDYVGIGSLSTVIHEKQLITNQFRLDWERRSAIALSVARAVSYIHSTNDSAYHGNVKSTSILLSENYEARLYNQTLYHSEGHDCPGTGQSEDIHSFGLLLYELLTGYDPYSSLVIRFSSISRRDQWATYFDQNLVINGIVEEEMVQFMELAIDCCKSDHDLQPLMFEVAHRIEQIQRSRGSSCFLQHSCQTQALPFRIRQSRAPSRSRHFSGSPRFRIQIRRFRVRRLAMYRL